MKKDGLENVRAEPVKVPHWVRGQESAEIIAPGRRLAGDARPRQQRRHPGRWHRGRAARRAQLSRARRGGRPASRAGSSSSTSRSRPTARPSSTAAPVRRAPPRSARSPCSIRSVGPPGLRTPHTGSLRYAEGQPADSRRGDPVGRRRAAAAHAGPRHAGPRPAEDGGEVPAGRRLGQRRSARSAAASGPTKWSSSAATSIRGTSAPDRPTTAAGAW